jgi:hypothetical protein
VELTARWSVIANRGDDSNRPFRLPRPLETRQRIHSASYRQSSTQQRMYASLTPLAAHLFDGWE